MNSDQIDAAEWLVHARLGDFTRAWEVSDRILARHRSAPDFARPRHLQSIWTGDPVEGRHVLVRCYHGLGDTIQFVRFVPPLTALAREVTLWVQPPLLPLFRGCPGIDRLLPLHDGDPEVHYDVDVEIMELPYVFRTTLEGIPRDVPYLRTRPAALPSVCPRVGVVWRAGEWERHRSLPFDAIVPLLDVAGVSWLSLQQDRRRDEAHARLVDASHRDLCELAGRIAALDLLITVDSMPAHLAGALGVPVWTLLPREADWRWLEGREDSPWYPTMRLFRQQESGGWAAVVLQVQRALAAWTVQRVSPATE